VVANDNKRRNAQAVHMHGSYAYVRDNYYARENDYNYDKGRYNLMLDMADRNVMSSRAAEVFL